MNAGVVIGIITLVLTAPPAYIGAFWAIRKGRAETAAALKKTIDARVQEQLEMSELKAQVKRLSDGGDPE